MLIEHRIRIDRDGIRITHHFEPDGGEQAPLDEAMQSKARSNQLLASFSAKTPEEGVVLKRGGKVTNGNGDAGVGSELGGGLTVVLGQVIVNCSCNGSDSSLGVGGTDLEQPGDRP